MHFVIDVLETLLDPFLKLVRAAAPEPAQLFRTAGFRTGTPFYQHSEAKEKAFQ
jgi:hypothetical protein